MTTIKKCCPKSKLGFILMVIGAVVVIAGIAAIVYKVLANRKRDEEWDIDEEDCCFYSDSEEFDNDDE
jgi:hypothetical protein